MKTRKGIAKVCKKRPGGTVKIGKAGGLHNTGKKSGSQRRKIRSGNTLATADMKRLKDLIK